MDVYSLRTLYLNGLQEFCDAEAQLASGLPAMLAPVHSAPLRLAVEGHASQTADHEKRLEAILRRRGTRPRQGHDQVAVALLRSAEKTSALLCSPDLHDAALIASLRRIKHHEIADCTTIAAYAAVLLLEIDRRTLLVILAEKRAADLELERFEGGANQLALLVSTPAYA